jgi:hypothetical protein
MLQLVARQQFCKESNKQQWEPGSLSPVIRLRNNKTVFSVWSVPQLCNKIHGITDVVEKRIGKSAVQFGAVSEL